MKTQMFTEQQLKDLASGKEVQTCEPVKKGEEERKENGFIPFEGMEHSYMPDEKDSWIEEIRDSKNKLICKVGEVRQAVNEKGEKQCKNCRSELDVFGKDKNKEIIWRHIKRPVGMTVASEKCFTPEPLLVRLKKIEEETYDKSKEFWFQTWKQNK